MKSMKKVPAGKKKVSKMPASKMSAMSPITPMAKKGMSVSKMKKSC